MKRFINFIINKIFGEKCEHCGKRDKSVKNRRMNTAYCDDELNFCKECIGCFEETEKMWAEQWEDYNGGRL